MLDNHKFKSSTFINAAEEGCLSKLVQSEIVHVLMEVKLLANVKYHREVRQGSLLHGPALT